jgi:ketosteroid isomerase-like protein
VSENVELLRRSADAFNAGDLKRYFNQFVAPDVVWRTSAEDPDAATHVTGGSGVARSISTGRRRLRAAGLAD